MQTNTVLCSGGHSGADTRGRIVQHHGNEYFREQRTAKTFVNSMLRHGYQCSMKPVRDDIGGRLFRVSVLSLVA